MPVGCTPSHAMHAPLLSKPSLLSVLPSTAFSLFNYASIVRKYFFKHTRFISTSKDFTFLWMFYHFLSTLIPASIFISKTPFSRNSPWSSWVWPLYNDSLSCCYKGLAIWLNIQYLMDCACCSIDGNIPEGSEKFSYKMRFGKIITS